MKFLSKITVILSSAILMACSGGADNETELIRSLDDLDGKTVAVLGGSVQDLMLSTACPNSEIMRSDSDTDTYTMVDKGKACATMCSSLTWKLSKKNFPNLVEVGDPLDPVPIAFAFNKQNTELLEKFNVFLKDYLADNDIDKALEEWSNTDNDKMMPSPDEVSGENGTLHFAVSAITVPYDFIKRGQVSGLEPEILARFAMSLNMKWEFVDIAFSGLISHLQSGKSDAASSIMCITEERKQSVNFSDPWSTECSVLIVNRQYVSGDAAGEGGAEKQPFFKKTAESFEKSVIKEDRWKMILQGLKATVLISLLAALFGTLLGMLLCFTSMRRNRLVSGATNAFIEFMRCMPQVVFLMIMFYIVFGKSDINGMWVAVIAFSLCFAAYTSVIFRSSVESIDKGQTEAALSMGFSKLKAFINVILPQTVQRALPVYKGEFIGLVKATSIVGYIAVMDLTKAGDIIRSRTYEAFFPLILVTIMYFLVIWVLTIILKYIEAKTQPKRKKFFK